MSFKKQLEHYLEIDCCFRDYTILPESKFGKVNRIGVHQKVEIDNIEWDVGNALQNFHRDGFGHIFFYLEKSKTKLTLIKGGKN
jgi:hypothetical protein